MEVPLPIFYKKMIFFIIFTIWFLLCIAFPLYLRYHPSIEVVPIIDHYNVYLWYNMWDGSEFRGRVYIYLFKI